jgi:hypothetical protein
MRASRSRSRASMLSMSWSLLTVVARWGLCCTRRLVGRGSGVEGMDGDTSLEVHMTRCVGGRSWGAVACGLVWWATAGVVALVLCCVGAGAADGASWSIESTQSVPSPNAPDGLTDVSCASQTFCVAVGDAADRMLVERWNGTVWAIQSTPAVRGAAPIRDGLQSELTGVSCTSQTAVYGRWRLRPPCARAGHRNRG